MEFNQLQKQYLNGLITDHIECNYEKEYEEELGFTLDFINQLQNKINMDC